MNILETNMNFLYQTRSLTVEENDEARFHFTIIDSDRNGLIQENELDNYFRQSKQELRCFSKLIIQIFGSNDCIDFDQFLKFYKSLIEDRDSDQFIGRYIFDYIDSDHNGKIEAEEFEKVVDIIKFPEGTRQDAIRRANQMDYNDFSKLFYIILRMAWRNLLRRNTI